MDINYAYNTDSSILLKKILNILKSDAENQAYKNVLVVTPEGIKDDVEISIKKEGIIDPDLKIKVSTISDIASNINRSKDRTIKKVNQIEEQIIVQAVLNNQKDRLRIYGDVYNEPGFTNQMLLTLNAIESSMSQVGLKNIEPLIDNSILKDKIIDINSILNEMKSRLSKQTSSKYNFYLNASELIKEHDIYSGTSIIFAFFEELTPVEIQIVNSMIKNCSKATFAIKTNCIDREPTINSLQFFKTDYLINKIMSQTDLTTETIDNGPVTSNKEIEHISKFLYKYPFDSYNEKTDYIFINNYKTLRDEMINISINIKESINNNAELQYDDIVIVAPNLNSKISAITEMLTGFEIPFNIEGCNSSTSNIFIKDLVLIKELISKNFDSKSIINYLRCGDKNFNQQDIFTIESFLLKNIIGEIDLDRETWVDRVDIIDEGLEIDNLRKKAEDIIRPVHILIDKISNNSNNVDICKQIYNFLNEIKINIESTKELTSSDITIWNGIIRSLENISKSNNVPELSLEQILNILISESKNLNTGEILNKANSISIVDINNINRINPKVMYVLDLNEGVLPSNISNKTLFTSEDIEQLSDLGISIESTSTEKILNERFAVYDILSKSSSKLYLSYLDVDKDGKIISPSQTIERLKQLFKSCSKIQTLEEKLESAKINKTTIAMPRGLIAENIASEINKSLDTINTSNIPNIEGLDEDLKIIKSSLEYRNITNLSNRNKLNNLYFSDTLSVSKLEKYNKCPFAYFAEVGLKLKIPEVNKPDARHRGIFIHTIIENFGREIEIKKIDWEGIDNDYIESKVKEISSNLINMNQFKVFTLSKKDLAYVNAMEDIAIISLKAIKEHIANSFFEPIGHEISFGEKSTYPSILMKLPSGKRIKIRGQIDRADKYTRSGTDYLRVIDYKTGDTAVNFSDIVYGLQLQLFVYLNALLENYKLDNVLPAGLFYLNLHNPIIKTNPTLSDSDIEDYRIKELKMKGIFCNEGEIPQSMDKGVYDLEYNSSKYIQAKFKNDGALSKVTPGLSSTDITTIYSYTKEKTIEIASQMISGDISIKPIKKNNYLHCEYCKYHSICLFDETIGVDSIRFLPQIQKGDALNIIREKVLNTNEQTEMDGSTAGSY